MKLKISFCNRTVLRTDLTRFAPLWGLYTLALGLAILMGFGNFNDYELRELQLVRYYQDFTELMVGANGIYAMLVVMTLFGDMLTPRLCNALHAMPVSRDGFYTAHLFAALLMGLVPDCLVFLLTAFLSGAAAPAALWLLLAAVLQYLFYLGAALVAVQLAGNRIAFVLIYGMLNFTSLLLLWFAISLYVPMLYGMEPDMDVWTKFCPTIAMAGGRGYFYELTEGKYPDVRFAGVALGDRWLAAGVCAAVGVVSMALGQILYRKRALETAGDFLAVKGLRMVFLVLYTLMIGGFFHLIPSLASENTSVIFLLVGLLVGCATGPMLLYRRTRVFRKRMLLPLAGLLAVLAVTLGLTLMDVGNVVGRVPETGEIEKVAVCYRYDEHQLVLTEPEDLDTIRSYHAGSLEGWQKKSFDKLMGSYSLRYDNYNGSYNQAIKLEYTLKNGKTMTRIYPLGEEGTAPREAIQPYLSRPEMTFGVGAEELEAWLEDAYVVQLYGYEEDTGWTYKVLSDRAGLARAILADCREENFTNKVERVYDDAAQLEAEKNTLCHLEVEQRILRENSGPDEYDWDYISIPILRSNIHTAQWTEAFLAEQEK